MPWYLPWSESIKNRLSRYLLQRYLGQFLEEKLTLDQLTVDLYNGTGSVSDVRLDVQALNELGEQQNLPIEFVDGFISEVSVSIPWSSILRDGSYVEVSGLVITVQPKQRADSCTSMFESMWNSMTSSMQLAEECLKQGAAEDNADQSQPLEGLELFAQTIDSILSRVKVKFVNTTLRLEHVPKDSNSGVAIEFRIKNMDYLDEAGTDPPTPPSSVDLQLQQGNKMYQIAAFTTKKFYLEGVTIHSDEYPTCARTFSRSVMSLSTTSTPDSKGSDSNFQSAPATPPSSPTGDNMSADQDPILFGRLTGRQEVSLKLRQTEGIIGPKVELEVNLGALTVFLSPRQLHTLAELVHGLASPDIEDTSNVPQRSRCTEKPMDPSDYRRIEQELQQQLNPDQAAQSRNLQFAQGWSTASLEDSDEEFLPMRGVGGVMSDSTLSTATSMDSSVSSSASSKYGTPPPSRARRKKSGGKPGAGLDSDPTADVSHFHVRIASFAAVLLHEDVLTMALGASGTWLAHSSVQQMKRLAQEFFNRLGFFVPQKDLKQAGKVFEEACTRNHLRLFAAPVLVEGDEKTSSHASAVSFALTAASVELTECLPSETGLTEHVDLLRFESRGSLPDLKLTVRRAERLARGSRPHTDVFIQLQPCSSEVDLSIVDRVTALLNPQPLCRRSGFNIGATQDVFRAAVESPAESTASLKLCSPSLRLDVRFPCPDLRPMHDMDRLPWWSRSVRKDVLSLQLADVTFTTTDGQRYEMQCREVLGSFLEGDTDVAVPFLEVGVDEKSGNSLADGFGWPRLVIQVFPEDTPTELEELPDADESLRPAEPLETTGRREPSPFSSKKIIHESDTPHERTTSSNADGEELVIPGDRSEMAEFAEHASSNTRVRLEISLPCATLHLSSKHLYELIYNRISTDMMLWEPAAPKPTQESAYFPARDIAASLLQESLYPAFSMCKSGVQLDSDSDSDASEPVYYSVYEHKQRQRRRQQATHSGGRSVQSKVAVTLAVGRGAISLNAPARDTTGNVIPGQRGEIRVLLEEGNMFAVSGFQGKSGLGYVCVQVGHAQFYHSSLVSTLAEPPLSMSDLHLPPTHLENTIYRSERGAAIGSTDSGDMVTVAIKIHTDRVKTFRVAVALRSATLRHRAVATNGSWFSQLVDVLDVMDYPVPGYNPPGVVTELHLHLWDCAVDYRPLYLPLKSVVTMGSFTVSSNIAAATSSSTLRFIAEDAALFISDKIKHRSAPVDLRRDYVCVIDLGLFELSLRLCDKSSGLNVSSPKVDLRASNNVLHVRTCSDSGRALTELLTYFAADGDLALDDHSNTTSSSVSTEPLLVDTGSLDNNQNSSNLSKSQTEHVHDLMEEAMKETCGDRRLKSQKPANRDGKQGVEIFFFPDENHPLPSRPLEASECLDEDDDEDDWEDDFCMVDKEAGSGVMLHNGFPEVRLLTEVPVRVIDNHFAVPMGKTDLLKAPKHYPNPVLRYTLREMTIVWHMYGGEDFALKPAKKHVSIDERTALSVDVSFATTSPTQVRFKSAPLSPKLSVPLSWQARGGPGRQHEVLMELQLNKIRFQHEVYPEYTLEASRQVLLVSEVEVRDRLASSQINKFLYQHSTEARPKQSHANMVLVRAVHIRPDPKLRAQECSLKVSMLPLRLNIDQDSLLFLVGFFTEISDAMRDTDDSQGHVTPTHRPPVMSVNVETTSLPVAEPQSLLILLEDDPPRPPTPPDVVDPPSAFPIFFRSFTFSPEVPVRLDYQGKHVDMTHGPLAGLLMGLGQLNCSELRLKRLNYRHGLLGFDKLLAFALAEWLNDIKKNQLPSLLGGVGPMHALVQLFQGIRDLFWLPIEQYQKDGRIVRGLQRGANSFTTSTAMAALELANRLVQAIQSTAEMAYDMLSPGPSVRRRSRKGKKRRYRQPADLREGMANAYMLVRDGVSETAQAIVRVASEEHDQKGVSGAVGGVLRQIPPTVVKPIILATEATSNLLGGMRSQLVPDARREAAEKWRCD